MDTIVRYVLIFGLVGLGMAVYKFLTSEKEERVFAAAVSLWIDSVILAIILLFGKSESWACAWFLAASWPLYFITMATWNERRIDWAFQATAYGPAIFALALMARGIHPLDMILATPALLIWVTGLIYKKRQAKNPPTQAKRKPGARRGGHR